MIQKEGQRNVSKGRGIIYIGNKEKKNVKKLKTKQKKNCSNAWVTSAVISSILLSWFMTSEDVVYFGNEIE